MNVSNLPHEGQPALTADSSTSSALWHLSLVLREIAESLEPSGDKREPLAQLLTEELTADDGECKDAEKRDL